MNRFAFLGTIACLLAIPSVLALPSVSVLSPVASQIFTSAVVPLACNATDSGELASISLSHNATGVFGINSTRTYGEAASTATTMLLCHWNSNLTCQGGETASNSSTYFEGGKYSQAVHVSGTLTYPSSNNIDFNQGTIEFWVNLGVPFDPGTDYYFLHLGSSATTANELAVYVSSGNLHFSIWNQEDTISDVYQPVDLVQGVWYHVAAIWDLDGDVFEGRRLTMFFNMSNASDSYFNSGSNIQIGSTPLNIYLGSDDSVANQGEVRMDDLHIFSDVRNSTQINDSYQRGMANLSSQVANWSISLADGSYVLGCSVQNNQTLSAASSNVTFFVDAQTPPALSSLYTFPNSSDALDPGVLIRVNATLSDISGVAAAVLGYRRAGTSSWTNVTMRNSSLGWGANFTASLPPGTWEYRVWSNDSLGREGYSNTSNVTVDYDYNWNLTPTSFGNTLLYIGSTGSVGVLLINNTGDYPLNFDLSSSYASTFFNVTEPFDLSAGSFITVNVTATASLTPSETSFLIYVNTTTAGASPTSLNTTATLTSYLGGPHLDTSIEVYASTVTQSTLFNLSARVKNIGNETATGVWINWTLPAGWSNTSGSVQLFIGNISSGGFNITNLTVFPSPATAAAGVRSVSVNATSRENKSDDASQAIVVFCSSSDGVCGASCTSSDDSDCSSGSSDSGGGGGGGGSGGGGGGGGGAPPRAPTVTHSLVLVIPDLITVERGSSLRVNFSVRNMGNYSRIRQALLAVAGLPNNAVEIPPAFDLGLKEQQTVWVTITPPVYLAYGPHAVTFTVQALSSDMNVTASTPVFAQGKTTLLVVSPDASSLASQLQELASTTLQTQWREARAALDAYDYDTARLILVDLRDADRKTNAIEQSLTQIRSLLEDAQSAGLPAAETHRLLDLAERALARGDLDRALDRAQNAQLTAALEITGRLSSARFAQQAWTVGPFIFIALLLSALVVHKVGAKRARTIRYNRLKKEQDVIRKKIRDLQANAFQKQTISLSSYRLTMRTYQDRLGKIERLLGGNSTQRMRELQKSYFSGAIGRVTYRRLRKQLRSVTAATVLLLLIPLASATVFDDAAHAILVLDQEGLPTHRLNDTLSEALALREQNKTIAADAVAENVLALRDTLLRANALVDDVEALLVEHQGQEWDEARSLFVDGETAFREERFEDAEHLLIASRDHAEALLSSSAPIQPTPSFDMFPFFVAALAVCAGMFFVYRVIRTRRTVRHLRATLAATEARLRTVQRSYFDGKCSREEYLDVLRACHKKRALLEKEIALS